MASLRRDEWEDDTYTPAQIEACLDAAGVEVVNETADNFMCFCPYHGNRDTPAFTVHKTKGLYFCWNPSCNMAGQITTLLMEQADMNAFEAARFLIRAGQERREDITTRLERAMAEAPTFVEYPQAVIDALHNNLWGPNSMGLDYMREQRGFSDETLKHYEIGYCDIHPLKPSRNNMVLTPMHDPRGMPVGMIGRRADPDDKTFKNTDKLPSSKTLFNLHRARKYDSVYVTEANFDGLSVYEATREDNFVSTLMGYLSPRHIDALERHFRSVVVLTDSDEWEHRDRCQPCTMAGRSKCVGHNAGRTLGLRLSQALTGPKVYWAVYSSTEIYFDGLKDANRMLVADPDRFRSVLEHPISTFEYMQNFSHPGLL